MIAKMIVIAVYMVGFWIAVALLASVPTWWLWNWLAPPIFGLPEISLIQTVGLLLLSSCLFGSRVKVDSGPDE